MEGGGVLKQGCHSGLQLQRTPSWTPVCVCVCVCALGTSWPQLIPLGEEERAHHCWNQEKMQRWVSSNLQD